MPQERLLTIRDTSRILGITEKEVITLAEDGRIPAYKVGGVYLRFKKEHIEEYKKKHKASGQLKQKEKTTTKDKIKDFLYFGDFYIFSTIIILLMLFFIFKEY